LIEELELMGDQNRSQNVFLAARPGRGKLSFALTLAREAIFDFEKPVAFISPELDKESLVQTLLAGESYIAHENIREGEMTDAEHKRFIEAMSDFNDSPVYIDDSPSINTTQIKEVISDWSDEHGSSLVIVDYLEMVEYPDEKVSREKEINHIANELNQLTKELGVSILSLGQLNRNLEDREDKSPILDDLRAVSDKGAENFDQVWFLHRNNVPLESERPGELANLKVVSMSDDSTKDYPLLFETDYLRFREPKSSGE